MQLSFSLSVCRLTCVVCLSFALNTDYKLRLRLQLRQLGEKSIDWETTYLHCIDRVLVGSVFLFHREDVPVTSFANFVQNFEVAHPGVRVWGRLDGSLGRCPDFLGWLLDAHCDWTLGWGITLDKSFGNWAKQALASVFVSYQRTDWRLTVRSRVETRFVCRAPKTRNAQRRDSTRYVATHAETRRAGLGRTTIDGSGRVAWLWEMEREMLYRYLAIELQMSYCRLPCCGVAVCGIWNIIKGWQGAMHAHSRPDKWKYKWNGKRTGLRQEKKGL